MISQWEEYKKRKKGNKELKFILTRVQEGASLSSNTRCLTHAKQNETVQFPWMDEEKEEEENQIWW
jgi:riboflavin synthase alpha subunit